MQPVDYLRISLIDRCNFRCQYCMPDGEWLQSLSQGEWLTAQEIQSLLEQVLIPVGFRRFRLTGGEPLLRPDVVEIVDRIAHLPQVQDLAMTTNGFLLSQYCQALHQAGLKRLNISLDTLNPQTFQAIVQLQPEQLWARVWEGIQQAYATGFNPLKLNVVVIPGLNDHEVLDLAALTLDRNWHVRFIEFMPIGNATLFTARQWIPSQELRQRIRDRWGLESGQVLGNGPADVFQIPGAQGTLGFISQMSECFCDRCNRMRLSADGWLRPCLLNETGQLDLKTPLRAGVSWGELQQQVRDLLALKPEINYKDRGSGTVGAYTRTMSHIGG
ncbi:GTP 3',8-cyclase MoaA [Lyngbya confervoides]|uniref:GTP 3',8-cyclase n=1 Tax=Lyngbya confervoides BDU141951 TaxID=1574623 RepID=A0ABD4SX55_9CYAN|nr:GTP 3',8-cyclase MoaA [Lyngbya confervoides]MCM1981272.1 GTP 3',8-cyclase MoaA [Lyngbya confervoides BDU141951]